MKAEQSGRSKPALWRPGATERSTDEQFMGNNGWTDQQRREVIQLNGMRSGVGRRGALCCCDKATGEPIAFLHVMPATTDVGDWHLAVWTVPGYRGQGFGTEAVRGILQVLGRAGIDEIYSGTATDNEAMRNTLVRADGIEHCRTSHTLPNGETTASIWYRLETTPTGIGLPPGNGLPPGDSRSDRPGG